MADTRPTVSIGLAVYNGIDYIREAIDSILAQTYTDFELIISDNASTDGTSDLCRDYAARDPRIRYSRNAENIGGANNENLTFALSRGKYFRWAAHDDMIAPTFLVKTVAVLDATPSVVLCSTMITEIDAEGTALGTVSQTRGNAPHAPARFADLMRKDHHCEATYGLIRADALRRSGLQQNYTDSDRTLLCELSLYGRFHEVPEPLFFKRYHAKNMYVNMRARMVWFDPSLRGKAVVPYWMQFFDYLRVLRRAPISTGDKARCYGSMLNWLWAQRRGLAGDLLLALRSRLAPQADPYKWRSRGEDVYNWE